MKNGFEQKNGFEPQTVLKVLNGADEKVLKHVADVTPDDWMFQRHIPVPPGEFLAALDSIIITGEGGQLYIPMKSFQMIHDHNGSHPASHVGMHQEPKTNNQSEVVVQHSPPWRGKKYSHPKYSRWRGPGRWSDYVYSAKSEDMLRFERKQKAQQREKMRLLFEESEPLSEALTAHDVPEFHEKRENIPVEQLVGRLYDELNKPCDPNESTSPAPFDNKIKRRYKRLSSVRDLKEDGSATMVLHLAVYPDRISGRVKIEEIKTASGIPLYDVIDVKTANSNSSDHGDNMFQHEETWDFLTDHAARGRKVVVSTYEAGVGDDEGFYDLACKEEYQAGKRTVLVPRGEQTQQAQVNGREVRPILENATVFQLNV